MSERPALYFEDLPVGRKFRSREYEMTAEGIKAFARDFDPQYFHTDEEAAKDSFFHGLAASGWHTAAIAMRLNVESMPVAGGLIGAGVTDLRWFRPVRPGDKLTLENEIASARGSVSKPTQGVVKVKHITYDQNNQPVQEFYSTMIVPKRDANAPA